jgi:DNA-directed RNA polymerase III subunit RPC8
MDSAFAERLYIELDAPIRFRVEGDEFYDDEPGPPKATEGVRVDLTREPKKPPYHIFVSTLTLSWYEILVWCQASIVGQGLGPLEWWEGVGQRAEEVMEE